MFWKLVGSSPVCPDNSCLAGGNGKFPCSPFACRLGSTTAVGGFFTSISKTAKHPLSATTFMKVKPSSYTWWLVQSTREVLAWWWSYHQVTLQEHLTIALLDRRIYWAISRSQGSKTFCISIQQKFREEINAFSSSFFPWSLWSFAVNLKCFAWTGRRNHSCNLVETAEAVWA